MTKYKPGAYDANSIEYLKYPYVTALGYYDSTNDPWNAPTTGFYGAGRDGYWYVNGVKAITPNDGGTFSDAHCWGKTGDSGLVGSYQTGYGNVSCSGNTATLTLVNGTSANPKLGASISPSYRWYFPGSQEVDIQVDWANWSQTGGTFIASLMIGQNERNFEYLNIWNNGSPVYSTDVFANGTYYGLNTTARAETSGKIRFHKNYKSGDDVYWKSYYWNGSSWVGITTTHWAGTGAGSPQLGYSNPVYVALYVWGVSSGAGSIDFSNFTINAGTPQNRPGWTQPVSNGNCYCLGGEFPEKALIIGSSEQATPTSGEHEYLHIINAETEEVWLRHDDTSMFDITASNLTYRPSGISMSNGELIVSTQKVDNTSVNPNFYLSFTKDMFRAIYFNGTFGGNNWGYNDNVAGGGIYNSLAGKSEVGPSNANFYLSQKTNSPMNCVSFHDGTYFYSVISTGDPAARRVEISRISNVVYPQFSTSAPTMAVKTYAFCPISSTPPQASLVLDSSNNVYMLAGYLSQAYLCRCPYSAYNAGWGSTFSITEAYGNASNISGISPISAIGGTMSLASQARSLSIANDILYYPADEGIYFVNWNTSVGLIYGKSGSSATYEILPAYDKITTLAGVFSDSKNLLIATAVSGANYYSFIINIDSNVLMSSTDITTDIVTQPSSIKATGS